MKKIPPALLANPIHLLSVGFGSGLSPKAPGTFGTLAALPFWCALQLLSPLPYLLVVIVAFVLGVYLCGKTADALDVHDHGGIVWDEFVGLWIALFALPFEWPWIVLGFVLFRLFDIWKPWPIRVLDAKVHGGLGIMIDDVVAGVYALALLQWLRWYLLV
ncbi:phosphatidylglycerophosphatase A [Spongiibacter sp. KMU-158]|uniref:Phosphatidylglycerophosphatase A n=1 Tax=Spongiibacter pelagi TaxID=2760804 RepID=A0A927C0R1_9GAMM|nr:phosphatidylglycerophosphatase A [Spongiibacter pelagi]MBD2857757.1 phosphatidylglycerophosphatase A [Spongiibacter pelagi]